jgi:hypothetical protein
MPGDSRGDAVLCAGTLDVSNVDAHREYSAEEVTRLRDDRNAAAVLRIS